MRKQNRILLSGLAVIIFIFIIIAGLKGWNELVVPNLGKIGQFPLPILLGFSFFLLSARQTRFLIIFADSVFGVNNQYSY